MFNLVYTSGHRGVVEIVYVRDMYFRVCIFTFVCRERQLETIWVGMSGGCRAIYWGSGGCATSVTTSSPSSPSERSTDMYR
jgi:hypothetical protein